MPSPSDTHDQDELSGSTALPAFNDIVGLLSLMAAVRVGPRAEEDLENRLLRLACNAKARWILSTTSPPRPLSPSALLPRTNLLRQHAMMRDRSQGIEGSGERICPVFFGGPTHCSTVDWRRLEVIAAGQLECPKHHSGKVLICRVLTRPLVSAGLTIAVEDPAGKAINVTIMHTTTSPPRSIAVNTFAAAYPVGAILAVREPDVRFVADGGVGIRVEIPSDVVRVHPADVSLKSVVWEYPCSRIDGRSVNQIKESGNTYMARSEYWLAVCEYTYALSSPPTHLGPALLYALHSNTALANLKHGKPGAAYRDCLQAEAIGSRYQMSPDQKAKLAWRKAAAAYAMRLWERASELARAAADLGVRQATDLVASIARRQQEERGQYDWDTIFESFATGKKLDIADHVGPVQILPSPGKGRGVFLTGDVRAGDLLLVEKALVHASKKDLGGFEYVQLNLSKDRVNTGNHVIAVQKAIHQLMDNTGLQTVWDKLCTPTDTPQGLPIVSEAARLEALHSVYNIDFMHVEDVFAANVSKFPTLSVACKPPPPSEPQDTDEPTAVWAFSSMFNHSCLPNTSMLVWGDVAVIRATRDMPAGTELFIRYFPPKPMSSDSEEANVWHFQCDCPNCLDDAADNYEWRRSLVKIALPGVLNRSWETLVSAEDTPSWSSVNETVCHGAKALAAQIEATYAPDRAVKWHLRTLCRAISDHYAHYDKPKAIEANTKLLTCVGTIMASPTEREAHGRTVQQLGYLDEQNTLLTMFANVLLHGALGEMNEATAWLKTAYWAHQVMVGGGPELFQKRCGEMTPAGFVFT